MSTKHSKLERYLEYDLVHRDKYLSFNNYLKYMNGPSDDIEKFYTLSKIENNVVQKSSEYNEDNYSYQQYVEHLNLSEEYNQDHHSYESDFDEDHVNIEEYEEFVENQVNDKNDDNDSELDDY